MEKIYNVGVVGCGNISGIYLTNITTRFKNLHLYAIADLIKHKVDYAMDTYKADKIMTFEEMCEDDNIDLILNITTPKDHYDICKRTLLAGKHCYVEKPLSLSLDEGKELVALACEKGLLLGGAPDTFLGGGIQTCRKLIDDGFIGEPLGATAFMMCHGHESWHPDPEFYYQHGGGPMFDMGPYYLTALVSLLGPIKTVAGMTKKSFDTRTITSEPKHGKVVEVLVPTYVAGSLQFENGVIANMITTFDVWGSTLPFIEIYGTRGTLIVPDPNTFGGPVMLKTAHSPEFKEIPLTHIYSENSRALGLSDLAQHIGSGELNRANCELTCHVLEAMCAFHTSSDNNEYYKMTTTCERPKPLSQDLIDGVVSV